MRTGLVLSTGITGVLLFVTVIILTIILKIKFVKIKPQTKKVMRFFMILYSITAFICLIGSGLGFLELLSIPILWAVNFVPMFTSLLSAFYVNKSKCFKISEQA